MKKYFLLALMLISNAYGHTQLLSPKLEDTKLKIDESSIIKTTRDFKSFWGPYLKQNLNKTIHIKINWESKEVEAKATRDMQDNLIIMLQGGLFKQTQLNEAALNLILCHELGHYIGGAPKSFRGRSNLRSWSSAEGQADYFAVNKCMLRMLKANPSLSFQTKMENTQIESVCLTDQNCHYIVDGALNLSLLFAQRIPGRDLPTISSRSQVSVYRTVYNHPSAQCRLDTFIAAYNCQSEVENDFDNLDYKVGACLKEQNPEASRPACWFHSENY